MPIWRSYAPLKCKIFCWLVIKHRLWTSDRRARHGLQEHPDVCFTCAQEQDNVEHILLQCPYARMVWSEILQATGLLTDQPQPDSTLEVWWTRAQSWVQRRDKRKFDTLVILVLRTLWKQRNAWVFANVAQQLNTSQIIPKIKEEFSLWMFAKFGGSYATTGE
jgi:hypothetical protein